jgi:hypothetical protein
LKNDYSEMRVIRPISMPSAEITSNKPTSHYQSRARTDYFRFAELMAISALIRQVEYFDRRDWGPISLGHRRSLCRLLLLAVLRHGTVFINSLLSTSPSVQGYSFADLT